MKKLLTNKISETFLIGIILLFNARNWVYKLVPSNTHYKQGTIRRVTRKGIHYELDISDYQEWLVYFYCQSDSSDYLLNYMAQSGVLFDIGANIGQTALNMSKVQQSKGLSPIIYAFEPYPRTFQKLETNCALNPQYPVKTHNIGLGSAKDVLHMVQHSPSNSGGFRMTKDASNTIAVPVISLDEFVTVNKITTIDFIKIDVEGFEIQVLKGAEKTIREFKPILVFEYSLENIRAQQGNIQGMMDLLLELNYLIRTKEGITDPENILKIKYQTDLICIPN